MKLKKFQTVLISFICILLIFSNLFFFRPSILNFPLIPRIIWELVVSIISGLFSGILISRFYWKIEKFLFPFRKIFLILFAFSVFLAFMVTFQGGLKFTQNRLSAVPLKVSASPENDQSALIENIIYNGKPLDIQDQCQIMGNANWGVEGYLVLESAFPQGEVLCSIYPEVFGYSVGNQVEIYFTRQELGVNPIITIGPKEYQFQMKRDNGERFDEYISIKIPLTMGILFGKIIEFIDYVLILLTISLLISSRYSKAEKFEKVSRTTTWNGIFGITLISTLAYEILEWLFIVTKPSFLSTISIPDKIKILIFGWSLMTGLFFLILFITFAISTLPFWGRRQSVITSLAKFLPVIILSSLALLLLDNFTYTLFNFGIVTTEGIFRAIYALLYIFLILFINIKIADVLSRVSKKIEGSRIKPFLIPLMILVTVASLLSTNDWRKIESIGFADPSRQLDINDFPNIILITADGVDANHTSLYGYERDTTPRIKDLAKTSLVAENAFSNSGMTGGSLISIYTGKYPTTTRVLHSLDILKGEDSYQHFPGILNSMGYYTAQYSTPNVGDAFNYNLLSGFDIANGRSVQSNENSEYLNRYLQTENAYFIFETSNRIMDRLKHIFLLGKINNPQDLVQGRLIGENDQDKIDKVVDLLKQNNYPIFAHLHWMGTHGYSFNPKTQTFSKGKSIAGQDDWDIDFYDDSILEFDSGVGQIVDALISKGLLDKTVLIVGSDHGQILRTQKRIPLIIRFPYSQYSERITGNVQNIDIGPTILDYLGIEPPDWMEGTSLISGIPGQRPIYGVTLVDGDLTQETPKPPFFQFGGISAVYCNIWYQLNLDPLKWGKAQVVGHTAPCEDEIISDSEVLGEMINHLKEGKFDTTSLNNFSIGE